MNEKVKGVYWNKRDKIWRASMTVDGKDKHLGSFNTYEEAVEARKDAEIKYGYVPVTPAPKLKHRDGLTQQMLKDLLHYDPETGIFTWKVKTSNNINIGSIAGSINSKGYIQIKIDKKLYSAHILAFLYMDGKFPEKGMQVDHINHIRNDNRWNNLRIVTRQDNQRNCRRRINNTTGHTGVYCDKITNKWAADIRVDGKSEFLGRFDNLEDAISARKAAEIKYNFHENHGKLNQNQIKEVS